MNERILLVDDDPNVLNAFRRQLRKDFNLHFAEGGASAIEMVRQNQPFAVVISDMQMPDVNGLDLLCFIRDHSPETVRVMLTGNADQKTATDAVNEGQIFRFVNKPCSSEQLKLVLTAGLEQYRLAKAEQEILSQTLNGSIDLMIDVLSMVNPVAFGRANRVRAIVKNICRILGLSNSWQLEIAAALSQIGSVTVPSQVLEKSYSGYALCSADQALINDIPNVTAKLVGKIPRLQDVAKIIGLANANGSREIQSHGKPIVDSSRLLDLVLTYDSFAQIEQPFEALARIRSLDRFEDQWIEALAKAVAKDIAVTAVKICDLENGMILDEELRTDTGVLLVTKGQTLTDSLISNLENYLKRDSIKETINVRSPRNVRATVVG